MIPIYIPSYNRPLSIKTTKWLDESHLKYKVLLHSEKCKYEYIKAGIVQENNIIVTNAKIGITNQRNYIMDNLAKKNEWFITLDDNIEGFKRVVDKYYYTKKILPVENSMITQKDFNQKINALEFIELVIEDIKIAESINATYGGFATVDNYWFNNKKYKAVGYVISKAAYIKYTGYRYDENILAMDDYGYTADCLLRDGCVLINSWIKPINKHYESGGIGTYEERLPKKIIDAKYLMSKFPNLFRYKLKKGCHPKAEIQIRFTNPNQINDWRKKIIYEKNRLNQG